MLEPLIYVCFIKLIGSYLLQQNLVSSVISQILVHLEKLVTHLIWNFHWFLLLSNMPFGF